MNSVKNSATGRATTYTDFIWLQTAFLGDVILTTAAFRLAQHAFPGVRQHVITTAIGARALVGADGLASITVFDKRRGALSAFRAVKAAVRAQLPAGSKPLLLQAHRSYRSSFLARYLGLPTINYYETSLGGHAARRVTRVATLHETARIALLLEPLGVARQEIVAARPHLLPLPLSDAGWGSRMAAWSAGAQGETAPIVGIAPGSVWGTKRWTPEGFEALGRRLLRESDSRLVLLGSDTEAPLTAALAAALKDDARVMDLAGRTSLDDLRRIYPRLSLLVTNDSSPVHYASAFDVPTVAVFGATIPAMGFGPLATLAMTPGVVLACRPCSDHGPQICPLGHFRCMRDLSADVVFRACMTLLAR